MLFLSRIKQKARPPPQKASAGAIKRARGEEEEKYTRSSEERLVISVGALKLNQTQRGPQELGGREGEGERRPNERSD